MLLLESAYLDHPVVPFVQPIGLLDEVVEVFELLKCRV